MGISSTHALWSVLGNLLWVLAGIIILLLPGYVIYHLVFPLSKFTLSVLPGLIIFVIFALLPISIFYINGRNALVYLNEYRALQHASATGQGTVTGLFINTLPWSRGGARHDSPIVQFTASDGKSYQFKMITAGDSKIGDFVTVLYNPAHPSQAIIK